MAGIYTWDGALQRAKQAVLAKKDGGSGDSLIQRELTLPASKFPVAAGYPSSTNMKLQSQIPYLLYMHNNFGRNVETEFVKAERSRHSPVHDGIDGYHTSILDINDKLSQQIQLVSTKSSCSTDRTVEQHRVGRSQQLNNDQQNLFDPQNLEENRNSRCPSLALSTTSSLPTNDSPTCKFSHPARITTVDNDTEDNTKMSTLERPRKMANSNEDSTHSRHGRSSSAPFVPSAILEGRSRPLSLERARKISEAGLYVNPNYKGEVTEFDLRNATCHSEENCAVRIHRIDGNATLAEIFQIITHGKVLSFHLNPAVEGVHPQAAARLVFLTRAAAESFYNAARSPQGLLVRGRRIEVIWNRDKVSPSESRYKNMSRVIQIKGPPHDISVGTLTNFFKSQFFFQLVASNQWEQRDGYRIVELAFSSIRAQSESAMKCFKQYIEKMAPVAIYHVWYVRDPCDPEYRQTKSWR
ncbi:hypothetical protein ACMFMG_003321 [Clarireedia jacksonii]